MDGNGAAIFFSDGKDVIAEGPSFFRAVCDTTNGNVVNAEIQVPVEVFVEIVAWMNTGIGLRPRSRNFSKLWKDRRCLSSGPATSTSKLTQRTSGVMSGSLAQKLAYSSTLISTSGDRGVRSAVDNECTPAVFCRRQMQAVN